jgi:hypothetical protein
MSLNGVSWSGGDGVGRWRRDPREDPTLASVMAAAKQNKNNKNKS